MFLLRLFTLTCIAVTAGCGGRTGPVGLPTGPDAGATDGPVADRAVKADLKLAPDRPPTDPGLSDPDRVARACVVAASCSATIHGPGRWLTPSRCIDLFALRRWPQLGYGDGFDEQVATRLVQCAEKLGGCKAFFSCFGGNWIETDLCREGGTCQKNLMVTPNNNALQLDCSRFGATCVDLPTGAIRACCVRKTCAGTQKTTCSGTSATVCSLGMVQEFDCAGSGQICDPAVSYSPCRGTGAGCKTGSPPTCSGSRARYCGGGREASLDCGKNTFASACNPTSYSFPCGPAGSQCNRDFNGECHGKAINVCLDGKRRSVSCPSLGFSTCYLPGGGAVAACKP